MTEAHVVAAGHMEGLTRNLHRGLEQASNLTPALAAAAMPVPLIVDDAALNDSPHAAVDCHFSCM